MITTIKMENSSVLVQPAVEEGEPSQQGPADVITIDGMLVDDKYFSMADASHNYSHNSGASGELQPNETEITGPPDDYIRIQSNSGQKCLE